MKKHIYLAKLVLIYSLSTLRVGSRTNIKLAKWKTLARDFVQHWIARWNAENDFHFPFKNWQILTECKVAKNIGLRSLVGKYFLHVGIRRLILFVTRGNSLESGQWRQRARRFLEVPRRSSGPHQPIHILEISFTVFSLESWQRYFPSTSQPKMAQKCVHQSCGKTYTDSEEECFYHPGPPIFHEGQKGKLWFVNLALIGLWK